jgi:serine/threonine protein phosphatase PrpC
MTVAGVSSIKHKRDYMEDRWLVSADHRLYAVFDGHGGEVVASYCKDKFEDLFKPETVTPDIDVAERFKRVFTCLEMKCIDEHPNAHMAGTTATCIYFSEGSVWCANAGDSRSVLARRGLPHDLSVDDKPTDPEEERRIILAGGWVEYGRINGILAVSRAIGDYYIKDIATCEPRVTQTPIDAAADHFVILASDGVWDGITSSEAVTLAYRRLKTTGNIGLVAQFIVRAAEPKTGDNITVLLVPIFISEDESIAAWRARVLQDMKESDANKPTVLPLK